MHTPIEPAKGSARLLFLCVLLPWIIAAVSAAMIVRPSADARLDVNGEPLAYNAPCSTDTDCAARFGR